MALKIHPLDSLLDPEGTGRSAILYLGYIKVNLQLPGIRGYNEDILFFVILTMTYAEKVPVVVGSQAIMVIMKGELERVTVTWRQFHLSVVMF